MNRTRLSVVSLFCLVPCMSMMSQGSCNPQGPDFSPLAGVWSITRGETEVTFTFTVANGGEVTQESQTSTLQMLDPADFPPILEPLVDQWNMGLDDLNAALEAALPDEVLVSFEGLFTMRITDSADATRMGAGLINGDDVYIFIGDLSGTGNGIDVGAGAVLEVAGVEGSFDRTALTTVGKITRRLAVVLIGPNQNGLAFVAEIAVNYTGQRTGDLP